MIWPSRLDTTTLVKPFATPGQVHAAWITTLRRSLVGWASLVGCVMMNCALRFPCKG